MMNHRRIILFCIWITGIFVTSCFYMPSTTLYGLVRRFTHSAEFTHHFAGFWRVYGFFVVKGWHATEYAVFVTLCWAALRTRIPDVRRAVAISFAAAVLFAASDEWHQTFVPHRDGCFRDVLIDTSGALVVAVIIWLTKRP